MHNNCYFQVSLLISLGLSAKDAILIVGFATRLVGSDDEAVFTPSARRKNSTGNY